MTKSATTSLAELFQRIPKLVLFGAAALIQLATLAWMVIDRAQILREGTEITLQTSPVDPRDFLRGDYVVLNYDISQLPAGPLKGKFAREPNSTVFVKLRPNANGLYEAVSVHTDAVEVKSPEVLIRGHVHGICGIGRHVFCDGDDLLIRYNLESYFVPEGEGRKLEQILDKRRLAVVAAVLPSGRAAIKRLLVDGQPVYDEPWF